MDSEKEKGECHTQPLDVRTAHAQIASGDIHIIKTHLPDSTKTNTMTNTLRLCS